jgi:hypothetical protein
MSKYQGSLFDLRYSTFKKGFVEKMRYYVKQCFKWGFSQTVSGKISPKWTKWGKHSQNEHAYGIFSPIWENNPIGFFLLWDFSWDS